MRRLLLPVCALFLAATPLLAQSKPKSSKKPPAPLAIPGYTVREMEGFTLYVSEQTKEHENDGEFERKPMEVLELELKGISHLMQPKMLTVLQTIKVFVEWDDPESKPKDGGSGVVVARYWYDAGRGIGMLKAGRSPYKANNIEILNMKFLTGKWQPGKTSDQIILLHEMCHAIHAHILKNDNPIVKAAYNQAMERGLYQSVKHETGRSARAYAATNDHEYFAELCCAYLDRCSWYPFTREELKDYDPVGYKLMEEIWTPKDPKKTKSKSVLKTTGSKSESESSASKTDSKSSSGKSSEGSSAAPETGPAAEAAASKKLELAESLINADRKDKAKAKLKEIVEAYPGTDAAKKAKEMLEKLGK